MKINTVRRAGWLCGAPVERVMDQFQQFFDVERFQQISDRSQIHGVIGRLHGAGPAHHDDFQIPQGFDLPQEIDAVAVGQTDILNDQIDMLILDNA